MRMQEAYQEVAERTLLAARNLLEGNIHEMAGFCCYHAYESSASALAVKESRPHGQRVGHLQKLAIFREYANNLEEVEIRATLRQLNLLIGSARNKLLYPKLEEKRIKLPKDELSREQIERLVNDVEVIVNWVRQKISENLEGNF